MTREEENAAADIVGAALGAANRMRALARHAATTKPEALARALGTTAALLDATARKAGSVLGVQS